MQVRPNAVKLNLVPTDIARDMGLENLKVYKRIAYSKTHLAIFFDLYEFNLESVMPYLNEHKIKKEVLLQFIKGVQQLHSLGFTHTYVRPTSFQINKDLMNGKLSDLEYC